ncbi:hypothetical protein ACHWQZ_G016518, partial [Mnemiopsis leidyi]
AAVILVVRLIRVKFANRILSARENMNQQILGRTREVFIRQASSCYRPTSNVLRVSSHKNNLTPISHAIAPKRRAARRRATHPQRPECVLYSSLPSHTSSYSDVTSHDHTVLLFTESGDNPDQKKVLALSKMYDNILREMPLLLENHDYTIYTDDLEFISHLPILRTVHGRQSYKVGLTAWFRSLTLLYSDLYIDVLEVLKEKDNVSVRWGICGSSRINSSFARAFDGTSTFYPDDEGLIKTHILDKVAVDKWRIYQTISVNTPSPTN